MREIKKFDPWKGKLCTCPPKYSLSPYTGCAHRCLYCYASSYIRDFFNPRAKKDFLEKVRRDLSGVEEGAIISMSNSSDPYQPLEKKEKLTRGFLEMSRGYKLNILLVTRSTFITRDLDILKGLNAVCSMSIITLDSNLSRNIEKGAPLPSERLEAVEKLSKYIPVAVRFDPLIYPFNTREIPKMIKTLKNAGVRQVIVSTYKVRPDNFKRMVKAFPEQKGLWTRLYFKEGQRKEGYVYLNAKLRKELVLLVKEECDKNGLVFSSCREGFAGLNTSACDASGLFS